MIGNYYKKMYRIKKYCILYNTRPLTPLVNKNLIRKELKTREKDKIVIFVGGFWPEGRGIIELIQSAQFLDEGIKIVLLGYGSQDMINKMQSEIIVNKVEDKVFILPPQPPEKVMDYVMSADIGVNLIKRENKAQDFQSPWKLFEYCMAGLAILSTDLPFHRKIHNKYDIGGLCDIYNTPEIIAKKITELFNSSDFKRYKENARYAAEKEFNWELQEHKLLKVYSNIT